MENSRDPTQALLGRKLEIQRVRDSIDQIEEKANLDRFLDGGVGNPSVAQRDEIVSRDAVRLQRQFLDEGQGHAQLLINRRGSIVLQDRTDDRVTFQGLRRDRGVIGRSIGAAILFRHKGSENFDFAASPLCRSLHALLQAIRKPLAEQVPLVRHH
jgi:hypothetical protein